MKAYVRRWDKLVHLLEAIRETDTQAAIRMFDQAYQTARRDLPPGTSSVLVEF